MTNIYGEYNLIEKLSADDQVSAENTDEQKPFPISRLFIHQAPFDFYIFSGVINIGIDGYFEKIIRKNSEYDTAVLWITTGGGSPDSAYIIARLFQQRYEKFIVVVNGFCKSSGTLICLGADELLMGDKGHLGPLDIQIMNKEEFGERHSGLNLMESLNSLGGQAAAFLKSQFLELRFDGGLSTKQALDVTTALAGHLFSPITTQIDFMKYGEFTRSMRIGIEYGTRLAKHKEFSNVKNDAIAILAMSYPSHGFVIDRDEAAEKLFSCVNPIPNSIIMITEEFQPLVDQYINNKGGAPFLFDLRKLLESEHGTDETQSAEDSQDGSGNDDKRD